METKVIQDKKLVLDWERKSGGGRKVWKGVKVTGGEVILAPK